jgi:hypothetical protein
VSEGTGVPTDGYSAETGRSSSAHENCANTPKEARKIHTSGRREDHRRYAYAPIDGKPIDQVRHPRVRGCGHKFVVGHAPQHRNCKSCWNALFINDAQLSENIAKGIQELGAEAVGTMINKKLLTHFLRFITMVAEMEKWKRDHEPREPVEE